MNLILRKWVHLLANQKILWPWDLKARTQNLWLAGSFMGAPGGWTPWHLTFWWWCGNFHMKFPLVGSHFRLSRQCTRRSSPWAGCVWSDPPNTTMRESKLSRGPMGGPSGPGTLWRGTLCLSLICSPPLGSPMGPPYKSSLMNHLFSIHCWWFIGLDL